jgi:hypothetical protein
MTIWYMYFVSFGIFSGHLVYFLPFWYVAPKKSGNADPTHDEMPWTDSVNGPFAN